MTIIANIKKKKERKKDIIQLFISNKKFYFSHKEKVYSKQERIYVQIYVPFTE